MKLNRDFIVSSGYLRIMRKQIAVLYLLHLWNGDDDDDDDDRHGKV